MHIIITFCGYKGGVGKTTSAIHMAGVLSILGPTVLIDGDANRSALEWKRRGGDALPFEVLTAESMGKRIMMGDVQWVINDTQARPKPDTLRALARGAHFLVLPTVPETMSMQSMISTLKDLQANDDDERERDDAPASETPYRVLLTRVRSNTLDGNRTKAALDSIDVPAPYLDRAIRESVGFQQASGYGCLVRDVPSNARLDFAFGDCAEVTAEILDILGQAQSASEIRRAFSISAFEGGTRIGGKQ